jgi:catechol 2,3-dioxygenase-like lactoylglutathione lyase family enzyme
VSLSIEIYVWSVHIMGLVTVAAFVGLGLRPTAEPDQLAAFYQAIFGHEDGTTIFKYGIEVGPASVPCPGVDAELEGSSPYGVKLGAQDQEQLDMTAEGGTWVDIGNERVHISRASIPDLAVQVDNLDAVLAACAREGVDMERGPMDVGDMRFVHFYDPAGHVIMVRQEGCQPVEE